MMNTRMSCLSLLAALLATLAVSFEPARADAPAKGAPMVKKAVPAARAPAPAAKQSSPAAPALPPVMLKAQTPGAGPAAAGGIQTVALARCATGFSKTGENKNAQTGALNTFECTTPVITCPKNPVLPLASLDVQIISENPEGSVKRIRYTCTYYPAVP
jgi:hypothetical protein